MSRVTKRKHVMKEMLNDDFDMPKENQQIVRVIGSRGNNLHEVESQDQNVNEHFLVSMPTKFRKNMWVKRGDFLLIEPIEEGDKVKGEIFKILSNEHIKEFTKCGIWPKKFTKKRELDDGDNDDATKNKNSNSDDDDDDLVPNSNRPNFDDCCTNESSSSSNEEDET